MSDDYRTARDRLAAMLENLNTDDDGPVMLLYPMTVADSHNPDAQALLGVIADGDLVALVELVEHRCDLTTLRAEVVRLRNLNMGLPAALSAYQTVLDLIDKTEGK